MSNERCSSRITVSPSRALWRLVGAILVSPKSCETVTVTDPPVWTSAGPKPQPAKSEAEDEDEDGGALHRTVNTTRVVPRASGVRLPAPSIAIASST